MIECLVNGELSQHVHVTDRGFAYGDGLFESIAVFRGRPRFWQLHMERLAKGATRLGLPVPAQEVLLREVQTVCAGQPQSVARITLTRGLGGRGYAPPAKATPTRVVSAWPWPPDSGRLQQDGVVAVSCTVRLGIQPALGGIKHLNRLEQVLAEAEIERCGAPAGILLDQEGHVICGTRGNLFLVCGERLLTPRLDRSGVRGVMRSAIISAFTQRCELRRITPDMLPEAEEVFLTSAVRGIVPVRRIDELSYAVGPVTRELQAWLEAVDR